MGTFSDRSNAAGATPQGDGCTQFKLFADAQGHHNLRLELRDIATDQLLSSRTEIFSEQKPMHQARIDVQVKTPGGPARYYEEFPTPWTSPIPAFAKIAGPIYKYDPTTDTRVGPQLEKNSAEYKEAYAALTRVRKVSTPANVIEGLLGGRPRCEDLKPKN